MQAPQFTATEQADAIADFDYVEAMQLAEESVEADNTSEQATLDIMAIDAMSLADMWADVTATLAVGF